MSITSYSSQPIVVKASSSAEKLQQALKEKEELEKSLENAKKKVSSLQNSKKGVQEKVNELNNELTTITNKIYSLELQLKDLDEQIEESNALLEEAQREEDAQYASMKLRIQFMYENGDQNIFNVMFGSADMGSMLNALNYISELSEYDRALMDKLIELKELQAAISAKLEADHAEVEAIKSGVESQKQAVNVLITAKNQELTKIDEEIVDAKALQKQYEAEVQSQIEILAIIAREIAEENGKNYQNFMSEAGFLWPCPSYKRISSDFGYRQSPTAGASTYHQGVDMSAPYGADILAAQSGTVMKASYGNAMGNYIILNHGKDANGNTICTIYEHASSLCVSEGQVVYQGQTIAKVGSTGISTGNHLHFGVTAGGNYVSPWNYISRP